ncbi:MAG TPA: DUF4097 family beta strand repeat-containing protein [Gemmatimonadaceae bacterium]|nr:DUF4097 family beta strand repeat-containing protein [Gemmatimonadaceae bacterium]
MRRSHLIALTALAGTVALAGCGHTRHVDERAWTWQGDVGAGHWLNVRNTNGAVRVEHAPGGRIEVTATKKWRGRRPEEVRFAATREGDDVTVCALRGSATECDADSPRGERRAWWRRMFFPRSGVSVEFVVRVPDGVKVNAGTVNGAITIEGVTSDVVAETVNGSIKARTTHGALRAETVNGSITATIDSLPATGDITLETVNGSVVAELPQHLDARLEMSTTNGRLNSEYPLTMSGKFSPKELSAVIGNGGRLLKLETVNGSATLRKRGG